MKKKPIFKTPFSRNSKSSVWKPTFFLSKLNQKFFLHNTVITLVKLHTAFGLIWTTPWPDAKELFLKFSKIRNSRNSQNSVWKPNFFLSTLFQFFCLTLSLHWWYSIPRLVWFRQLLNTMKKKPIFKIPFSRNSKSSEWKPNFFPRQAIPKILSDLHPHYTGDTQYRVWFDLDNSLTRCKRIIFKILKNSQFAKFAKFRMKTQLFHKHALPFFLLYTLITLVTLHTAFGLIWTTP